MRQARVPQRPLQLGLAAEVFQRGILRRVGDAHMHDPLDACPPGRLEQNLRVADRIRVPEQAVVEAHPVGVVQHLDIFE